MTRNLLASCWFRTIVLASSLWIGSRHSSALLPLFIRSIQIEEALGLEMCFTWWSCDLPNLYNICVLISQLDTLYKSYDSRASETSSPETVWSTQYDVMQVLEGLQDKDNARIRGD